MAYDPNSSYEPPRRQYLERLRQPEPPAQNGYGDYAGYANTPYDQYDQGYGYGQQQHYGGYDGYDQQVNQRYDDGYNGGYGGPQQHAPQYQQSQERSYDPRYQPRAPPQRGRPPGQAPYQGQRGPPPVRGPAPYQGDPWGAPRQNGHPPQGRPPREQYEQRQDQYDQYAAPREPAQRPAPQQAQSQAPPRGNGKGSMEEWKAREKARMKVDAMSPEVLPFDNAFPVFGKKKKDRPDSETSQAQSYQGSSGHASRPTTSSSHRPQTTRENSYQTNGNGSVDIQSPPRRPNMGRGFSFEQVHGAPQQAQQGSYGYAQVAHGQQQPASNITTPVEEQYPEQWPMVAGQTPPKAKRPPQQSNGLNGGAYAPGTQYQQGYESSQPVSHTLPKQRGPPPIDTRQVQQQYQRPAYNDHQPLSPANVPQRPSTSQSRHPPPPQQVSSPLADRAPAPISNDYAGGPQKPWMQDEKRSASLGDIYDDYGAEPPAPGPGSLKRAPTTRDEEIEAEMPDFDSAAPSQTSMLHKRNQTVDKHLAGGEAAPATSQPPPPMPPMHNGLPQSSSLPDVRYEQPPYQPDGPHPGPRGPPRRGMTTGGYGGSSTPGPPGQYDMQYRGPPGQDPRLQRGPPQLQPPRAPFAHEPPVRRSLDDGRSIPYRNGPPPGQRFGPSGPGPGPRGGYPPQRPEFERMQTNQTVQSDPGMQRGGSVPPPRSGLGAPVGMANGMPLTQQRSAPEQQAPSDNPDALPHHPTPVRPGLMATGQPQPAKPPPVRNYSGSGPSANGTPHQRQASLDYFAQPVTHAELDRLRAAVDASPNNHKQTLLYVKKLVEAATVLAPEGGRADQKTTAKNRERYITEAYKRLKRLVHGGYPDAQFYLADCYGQGMLGLETDTKEAFKLYQAAAKAGHAQAAYRTAVCCEMGPEEGGGTSRDFPKAVQWYRRAAALGDGPAMYKLGAVLLKGMLGQQRNITEAVIWLKRGAEAADKDNPHALHELAQLHESSNTNPEIRNKVVADDNYARELFQQAANLEYKFSQFRLGQAYEYGSLGLPIDNRSSIAWYTKAAAQGEHQAELALSGWYLTGAEGILEHSDTEAYLWARKAASSEPPLAKAMFAMGYFTENGIGCPKSMEEARKWYGRAASHRFPKAIERLEELKKGGGKSKGSAKQEPANGKLKRKDQKHDEENCVVM